MAGIASMFGGGKPDPQPARVVETAPVNKQEGIEATDASSQKRNQARARSNQLVSGRTGSATRSGINVPGRA